MGTDADAKPGDEPSAHPGEEEADEPANDPTDVVRESEMSGRQQLLDALGKLFTVSEDVNVCLYCGSTKHGHLECEHEKRDEVRKVLKAVRASLEADSPTSDDVDMEPPGHKKDGSGATEGSGQTDEPTKSRFSEHQWYDSIRTMSEVGDLDEYGKFCIEGRDVTKLGPQNVVDLNEVIRDAIVRGGGDTWSVPDFMASYSDNNIRKTFYKRVEAPQDGFLKIIPTTGAHFLQLLLLWRRRICDQLPLRNWQPTRHLRGQGECITEQDTTAQCGGRYQSNRVCPVMTPAGCPSRKCSNVSPSGGTIMHAGHMYSLPQREEQMIRGHGMSTEANFRMTLLFKIMFHCARYGRRVREQVLAFGINKDIDRRSLTCIDNNVDADTHIPDEGLLLYPVAVRAPTGHKEGSSRDDVSLLSSLLSHPIAPNTVLSLPVCFHITKKTNLRSIWRQGLIPGGLGEGHRMFTFFNPYVPWDHRSWTITKSVDTRKGDYICLFIPTETLMVEYGGRLTDSGQIVSPRIIPFSAIKGGWIQDPRDQYNKTWLRLFVPSGDDQVVRSGTVKSRTVATKESILRVASQCIDAEDQPFDEIAMDAMNIVNQFKNNLIEPGGQEQYLARIKLIDYIVERKRVQTSGCRHCPHCINETPTKLAVCIVCWTELESCGIRPYRLQAPEDDEDEATKKELDEEVRRQEESLFKDTVNQAQENVSESNDYGFNPDEVDYNEGDDEEMDQEEEAQQEEDEIIEEDDDEMDVEPDDEPSTKLPAWTKNLESGSKGMPEDGLINNDVSEAAAHLYDNAVMSKVITMFRHYYNQRVTMTPEEYHVMMTETRRVRLDLDDFCPYTGEDPDGNLKRPTELELDELLQEKGKRNSWSEGEKMYSGRPRNMMMPVTKNLEIYEKMMEFLVCAGYTPESLGFLMPMNRMQADAQGKQEMRVTISNFLRRLLKGTFPEHESYTFFRSGSHGFPNCIELPAFSVYLSLREKEQRVELLFAAQQCGIPLPQNFVSKMAYAIQLAEAEAQRGKTEMKTKMAPTLGDEVVGEIFKAVGHTAASKFAKPPAKPSQTPEGTGSASSSSASAPKGKAMPKSHEPSKAPPAKPSSPKAAPKRAAGWERTPTAPQWKKVRREQWTYYLCPSKKKRSLNYKMCIVFVNRWSGKDQLSGLWARQ